MRIAKFYLVLFIFIAGCTGVVSNFEQTQELMRLEQDVIRRNALKSEPPEKQPVNWIAHWKGEGDRERLLYKIIDDFSFLNQDAYINLMFQEYVGDIIDISEIRFSWHIIPHYIIHMIKNEQYDWDIVPFYTSDAYGIIADGLGDPDWGHKHLVDFRDVPGFLETQRDFIIENESLRESTKGIFTGPATEGYYYLIYYNQVLADKIGLQIKRSGMTFNDLLGYLELIYNYNQINDTEIAAFYESGDQATQYQLFQRLMLSALEYSSDYTIPEYVTVFHQNALKKTLSAFEAMGKYTPLISSYKQNLWRETTHLVLEDKAVFYIHGTWMYNIWESSDSEKAYKMIPAELPVFKPIDFYIGGYQSNFAVLKNSPNAERAIDLLMHSATKDAVEDWIRYAKSPSGTIGHIQTAGLGGDVYELFVHKINEKYGRHIINFDFNLDYIFGDNCMMSLDELNMNLHALLNGEITSIQAYNNLTKLVRKRRDL